LKRESVNDAQHVLDLLKFGSLSVANGAQHVLALDQMRPDAESIKEILILSGDRHKDQEVGLGDGRL
jgi:hypothetical protein